MVKAYLAHRHLDTFGIVASPTCKVSAHPFREICFAGGNEAICVWDTQDGQLKSKLTVPYDPVEGIPRYDAVTTVECGLKENGRFLVAGYSNGDVRLWQWEDQKLLTRFRGHRGPVLTSCWSLDGNYLATGGADQDIILWDVFMSESRFRLCGHTLPITSVQFLYPLQSFKKNMCRKFKTMPTHLLSGAQDGQLKLWDLESQRCIQTLSTRSTAAVQAMIVCPDQRHVLVGMTGKSIEVFTIRTRIEEDAWVEKNPSGYVERLKYLEPTADFVLEFSGTLERPGVSKRISDFVTIGVPNENMAPISREHQTLKVLPNGSMMTMDGTSLLVPDQKALIFACSFSKHVEVIQSVDVRMRQARELRILLRRIEKLKKKSNKLREGGSLDLQLRKLLGAEWRSSQQASEEMQIAEVEKAISLIRSAVAAKKSDPGTSDSEVKSKKRSAAEMETSPESDAAVAKASSASMTFKMMSSRFELLGKGVHLCAGPKLVFGTAQNTLESYSLDKESFFVASPADETLTLVQRTTNNRSLVGSRDGLVEPATKLLISHDDRTLVSLSTGQIAFWDVATRKARLRLDRSNAQLPKEYKPISGFFLAGNDFLLIGDTAGAISLFDVPTARRVFSQTVHQSTVVAMHHHPSHIGFCTAGDDKTLKTFRFELDAGSSMQVRVIELQTSELPDKPTDAKYSHDGKYIAVSMKNHSIIIFFADTLKIHLTLYGHSLEVTSLGWSTDGQMLVSGSLDRHIKIWDTEFGNILRSLPAGRTGFVSAVKFAFDTHYVISTVTDGTVKLWDADSGDRISTLGGAPTEIRSLATTGDDELIFVSCSDRTIKAWERTSEQLFLSEEREREIAQQEIKEFERADLNLATSGARDVLAAARPTRKGIEGIRDSEKLIEVVDEALEEQTNSDGYAAALREWENSKAIELCPKPPKPTPKIELLGRSPRQHVLAALGTITAANSAEVLLGLPLKTALKIVEYTTDTLEQFCTTLDSPSRMSSAPLLLYEAETACRIATSLVQAHRRFLCSSPEHIRLLQRLSEYSKRAIDFELSTYRRNLIAFSFLAKANCSTERSSNQADVA